MHTRSEAMRSGAHSSSGSFELVLSAVIFGVFGYGLDRLFGTRPFFLVALVAVGFLGAAISLYYRYRYQMDQHAQARAAAKDALGATPAPEVAR